MPPLDPSLALLPRGLLLGWIFVLGTMIGSFLNVVAYRLPREESIAWPGSRCPLCGHALAWYDNVPVLGWLLLRGRCRYCAGKISFRYPLNEFATGVAFLSLAWIYGFGLQFWAMALLASALIAVFWIDMDHYLILNVITYPGIILGVVYNLFVTNQPLANQLLTSMLGAGGGFLLGWSIVVMSRWIFKKEGGGLGDVKLMAMLGAWLGWRGLLVSLGVAFFTGSLIGVALLAARRIRWGEGAHIPFGPALVAGAFVVMLTGDFLLDVYVNAFVPGTGGWDR